MHSYPFSNGWKLFVKNSSPAANAYLTPSRYFILDLEKNVFTITNNNVGLANFLCVLQNLASQLEQIKTKATAFKDNVVGKSLQSSDVGTTQNCSNREDEAF